MAKLYPITADFDPEHREFIFWCPGCSQHHCFIHQWGPKHLEGWQERQKTAGKGCPVEPRWSFNGDLERPTFSPSLLYADKKPRCHLYLVDGQLQFLGDCEHALAGRTVALPDLPGGE